MQFDLFNPPPKKVEADPPAKPKRRTYNSSERKAEMLRMLQSGPLSTVDAERFQHRGQATVGSLREEGHLIETTEIDGVSHYQYLGYEERIRVTPEMQDAYYLSAHWKAIARQRKEIDGFRCQECKGTEGLETHHWRYELFNEDVQHDLITFCSNCHENIHECASGSKEMHFPRFVSQEIANRISEAI